MISLFWKLVCVAVILIVIACIIMKMNIYWKGKTYKEIVVDRSNKVSPTESIFVSIPNYRDPETSKTIYDLFSKAYAPHRIYVGLCNQTENTPSERNVIDHTCTLAQSSLHSDTKFTDNFEAFFSTHVRVEWVKYTSARGPVIARAAIEKRLYSGEKYIMMIDSHMRFQTSWDEKLLETLHNCPCSKPILTMFPSSYRRGVQKETWEDNEPPSCSHVHTMFKELPVVGGRNFVSLPSRPTKQLFWTPCFSFTFAAAHKEVPYDPHARNLFSGEQISMTARLWTSGWNFYSPMTMICKHMYNRDYRPTFWELEKSSDDAERRVQCLLNMRSANTLHSNVTKELSRYGLGGNRTLAQFLKFADIDLRNNTFGMRAFTGLSPDAPNDEILAKFGSFENLRHLRRTQS